jgi:DNA-directed RNA polymerase
MVNTLSATYGKLYEAQLAIEKKYKQGASDRLAAMFEKCEKEGRASSVSLGQKLLDHQFKTVKENITLLVDKLLAPKAGQKANYTYIIVELAGLYEGNRERLLDMLTFIPFSALLSAALQNRANAGFVSATLSALSHIIGAEIQEEATADVFLKSLEDNIEGKVLDGIKKRKDRHYKTAFLDKTMKGEGFSKLSWDSVSRASLGAKLLELSIEGSGYFELVHAKGPKGDAVLEIRPTQWLVEAWKDNTAAAVLRAYRACPTVIPPAPWETVFEGGYYGDLRGRQPMLRSEAFRQWQGPSNVYNKEYLEKISQLDLKEVRTALDHIQRTPWVINRETLEVVQAIINRGGDFAGIARIDDSPRLPELTGDFTEEDLKKHKKKLAQWHADEHIRTSKALRCLSILKVAEEFSEFDKIYFPMNCDFRGRCYPIPSFSPQGDDITKGLLLFADPPECHSMVDIEWLMVHGANLAGVDKVSFEDRRQWVKDHEEQILRSAQDPLGFTWWATLDDNSIQFLAFCFEWTKWKQWEKEHGTPEGFKTGIPVAFDGTCSGLQHFSAILRDTVGGTAVNLVPSDSPQDIYRSVAEKVNVLLEKDAKKGTMDEEAETTKGEPYLKLGTKTLAQQWLLYGVNRKVTKRCVMTFAYGSKEYGFKGQILEDVIKKAKNEHRGDMFVKPVQAAAYLAKLIWKVIQEVVVKAVEGMNWLQKMARMVCKDGNVVTWVTPLGLPIQQAYMESNMEVFRLRFGGSIKRLYSSKPSGNIDKIAQVNGIAPNFIHSLDASHLQLTVLEAYDRGIQHFAMIHDSFGSPVAQAQEMFQTVRYTFHKMYTENNVLENFARDMDAFIDPNASLPVIPACGRLNLETVLNSPYMFA